MRDGREASTLQQAGGRNCRVQRAMAIPPLNHRDPWFGPWLVQLQADTRVIYNTDQALPLPPEPRPPAGCRQPF